MTKRVYSLSVAILAVSLFPALAFCAGDTLTLPAGSNLNIRLTTTLSTRTNQSILRIATAAFTSCAGTRTGSKSVWPVSSAQPPAPQTAYTLRLLRIPRRIASARRNVTPRSTTSTTTAASSAATAWKLARAMPSHMGTISRFLPTIPMGWFSGKNNCWSLCLPPSAKRNSSFAAPGHRAKRRPSFAWLCFAADVNLATGKSDREDRVG